LAPVVGTLLIVMLDRCPVRSARANRTGQTKNVAAYRLLARGTVEEKVELLSGKSTAWSRRCSVTAPVSAAG
jgi:hypothetical protein